MRWERFKDVGLRRSRKEKTFPRFSGPVSLKQRLIVLGDFLWMHRTKQLRRPQTRVWWIRALSRRGNGCWMLAQCLLHAYLWSSWAESCKVEQRNGIPANLWEHCVGNSAAIVQVLQQFNLLQLHSSPHSEQWDTSQPSTAFQFIAHVEFYYILYSV